MVGRIKWDKSRSSVFEEVSKPPSFALSEGFYRLLSPQGVEDIRGSSRIKVPLINLRISGSVTGPALSLSIIYMDNYSGYSIRILYLCSIVKIIILHYFWQRVTSEERNNFEISP